MSNFSNVSEVGDGCEIPSFNGSEKAKASDFANYFCSYSQIFHQKQMLSDSHRMASYHSAIVGNPQVFKDAVVLDVGTGSGILAVWAAKAGARRVIAIEYTDMAKNARKVMEANGVADIVEVVQGAVEDVDLGGLEGQVDIIISEWMGYFLLRESMLDSLIRARDKYLNPRTGLMFPSHCTMYLSPICDAQDRLAVVQEFHGSMSDWEEFVEGTRTTYGVDMTCLQEEYEKEQNEYYLLSSKWSELPASAVVATPTVVKTFDMSTCTIADSKGVSFSQPASFSYSCSCGSGPSEVSGFAGWFTSDFRSRTDPSGASAPKIDNPVTLTTAPGPYTHWGQQVFYLRSPMLLLPGETTEIEGELSMVRTKDNARLYNVRIGYEAVRKRGEVEMMREKKEGIVYQMP